MNSIQPIADLDRSARYDDDFCLAFRNAETSFNLGDCRAGMQPFDGKIALLGYFQEVVLVEGLADKVLPKKACHFQKTLVDLDVTHVRQAGDDSGSRVGAEGALEPFLGAAAALGFVLQDQHEAVGAAFRVEDHQVSNLLNPTFLLTCLNNLDHNLGERLPSDHAIHRVFAVRQLMAVPVTKLEPSPLV